MISEGLGPPRAELEARLGPIEDAGGVAVSVGAGAVRRLTFLRWRPPGAARPAHRVAAAPELR